MISVLTFQFLNYSGLEPDLLEEPTICNFKERQWIFKDIYCFNIPKGPSIFNFYFGVEPLDFTLGL